MRAETRTEDEIRSSIDALASREMRANYWIATDLRVLCVTPLPRRSEVMAELYPEVDGALTTSAISSSNAVGRLSRKLHRFGQLPVEEARSLATKFVNQLASPDIEYYAVVDNENAHPFAGFSYWTFWLVVVDRLIDRSVGLAMGASD